MPQFTQWNVPSPFSNVLFNPAAVDKSIAELGHLGVERERLDLDRAQMAKDQAFTDRLIEAAKNAAGTETGTAPAGGGGGGALGDPPDINTPAGQVAQRTAAFWSSQGYTPHQVAGILAGGPAAESGFNPAAVGDGGTSLGLYQHHADRMEAMKKRYGPNPTEAQQHEFAAWEISPQGTHAHVGAALKQAKTPEEAAAIWTKEFERPANADARAAQRAAVASRYLNYGNAGPRASLAATAPPEYNPAAGPRVGSVPPAAAPAIVPPSPTTAQIPPPVRAAAQALLAMPEAEAAVAYGPIVKELQAQGLAQNAPPEYPGHEAVAALVGGEAATPDVAPSRQAMRLGGTAAAGPAAGQTTLPPTEQPNQLYQTGIPGITLRLPGSGPLAPPPVVTAAAPPSPGTASGGAATRAPVLQQPAPAPSRVIPMDPQIQSGLFAGLTRKQAMSVAEMSAGGAKPAAVMLHIDQLRQHNDVLRQQNATNAAAEADANYRRQEDYRKAQDEAANRAETRADKAKAAEVEAARLRLSEANNAREAAKAHDEILNTLAPKIEDGTATAAEKRLYAGSYYATQQSGGQAVTMDDPNNPGQKIPAMITRRLPKHFPEPDGGALPLVMSSPGAPTAAPLTVEQGKAAGYADRLQQALPIIADTSPAAMSRWEQMLGKTPLLANSLISPEFQLHLQAERNFINAVLRQESGASIQPEEFASARQQYIPQPGDSPQVLAEKKRNRETKLAEMIREAGASYKPATTTAPGGSSSAPAMKPPPPGSKVVIP